MASLVNSYFVKNSTVEQTMLTGLVRESIQVMGRTYHYLPRDIQREELILGEDVLSKFSLAIPIEMYMENYDQFAGQRELFTKFGLTIQNSITLIVSVDRWDTEVKAQFNNVSGDGEAAFDISNYIRPHEGDLVYDSLTDTLFEIKFVDHDTEFYAIGKNYMYHLSCEAFIYSSESIGTGIPEIDAFNQMSLDIRENQLLTETGLALVQENCGGLIRDINVNTTADIRPFATDFKPSSEDSGFNIKNPFGGE